MINLYLCKYLINLLCDLTRYFMATPKLYLILLFTLCISVCLGQGGAEMSRPVDLPMVGANKVLCMRNGNTMLFHFEPSKGITVKVFDSARRQIASHKETCRYLDVFVIQNAEFKGLFDINGEAVLFFDQENHLSQHCLIRLRFNAIDGTLVEEKLMAESKSKSKTMQFYVMKNKEEDNYSVLMSTIKNYPKVCDVFVVYFNKLHQAVREVQLDVDRKQYDFIDVAGAEALPGGNIISLSEYKLTLNGTVSHQNEFDPTINEYKHHLAVYYLPKDSANKVSAIKIDVTPDVYPYHTFCTYNPLAGAVNLLLLGYKDAVLKFGLELLPTAVMGNLFLKLNENDLALRTTWINNEMANQYLKEKKDTDSYFKGLPLALFTSQDGLSTMFSESFTRYKNIETLDRPNLLETYLGNICVTQFDDYGKELWGVVLPKAQYYKSYSHYYYANQLAARWHQQKLLGDLPEEVYNRQFVSVNTYTRNKELFIVYNDDNKNFKNSLRHPGDTIYNFAQTNACYYKIDRNKEITRHYVFGEPKVREYKCSFIEGADFDEKRGVYAALVQYKKGDNISLCMAWSHLN
jgi:hypothetical protein